MKPLRQASISRRVFAAGISAAGIALPAHLLAQNALEKVVFGTNWLPQAEHGGFYQALADGTYARFGLDVTIRPGGPQVNNRALLAAERIDFFMGGNLVQAFSAVAQGIPTIVVAAIFQKDPQALISHPGQGLDRFEDLKNASAVFLSKPGQAAFFPWLKAEHGFRDETIRPYSFNAGPFLADKTSVQQAYVTSEPYSIEKIAGFRPNVFLLADHGFDTPSTLIETRTRLVETQPDLVKRFVEASILGWSAYMSGDRRPGDALILSENKDMSQDRIDYAHAALKRHEIVEGGHAKMLGIGMLNEQRIGRFFDTLARNGLARPDTDFKRAFTTQFVNKGQGMRF